MSVFSVNSWVSMKRSVGLSSLVILSTHSFWYLWRKEIKIRTVTSHLPSLLVSFSLIFLTQTTPQESSVSFYSFPSFESSFTPFVFFFDYHSRREWLFLSDQNCHSVVVLFYKEIIGWSFSGVTKHPSFVPMSVSWIVDQPLSFFL